MIVFALFLPFCSASSEEAKLKLPFYDWGACPFECCTYRNWETNKPVIVRDKPSGTANELFRIPTHQPVLGITGVVITTKPGVSKIVKPVQLGYSKDGKGPLLSLLPGEAIYTLHYLGEGYELFWYEGHTYSDQSNVSEQAYGDVPFEGTVKVESRPETTWWVKIKDKKGRKGWSEESDGFDNMDACG